MGHQWDVQQNSNKTSTLNKTIYYHKLNFLRKNSVTNPTNVSFPKISSSLRLSNIVQIELHVTMRTQCYPKTKRKNQVNFPMFTLNIK